MVSDGEMEIRTDIPTPRKSLYTLYIKRCLDVILSGMGLLVLSPVFLVVSVLEIIFHGFPIFYIDKRPGKNGEIFGLYKFRSMNNAKDKDGKLLHPSKRITPFGRLLRRYSIDELPGLINVFKGDMSVIGPRPLMVDYLPLYNERHKYRHAMRPGLACWDLRADNKLTSKSFTWNAQFESDIYYIEHCSFLLDVRMVIKTIEILLSKSEMRTNSDRVKFNGHNLNDTRTRTQVFADEAKAAELSKNQNDTIAVE